MRGCGEAPLEGGLLLAGLVSVVRCVCVCFVSASWRVRCCGRCSRFRRVRVSPARGWLFLAGLAWFLLLAGLVDVVVQVRVHALVDAQGRVVEDSALL